MYLLKWHACDLEIQVQKYTAALAFEKPQNDLSMLSTPLQEQLLLKKLCGDVFKVR